jgi:hypothetical protein
MLTVIKGKLIILQAIPHNAPFSVLFTGIQGTKHICVQVDGEKFMG